MVQLSEPFKWTLLLCTCSLSLAGPVQVPNLTLPPTAAGNQTAVKNIFNQSYAAYSKFAFGHDSLLPVSASFIDDRNGWGATIVDAMGTMILMGFDDLFIKSLEWVTNVDFTESKTAANVDLFETTIRYVGGMLSAYELTGKKYPILVQQSQTLVDKMAFAWSSPNQTIPYGMINFQDNSTINQTNVAEAGTLNLEWSRLSLYTGNQTYTNLSMKNSIHILLFVQLMKFFSCRCLIPQEIDPSDNKFVDAFITWGGGTDSYLEYLIKYARISNTEGKLLNNDTIVNIGLEIADSCWNTYASTETGIGPETFQFIDNVLEFFNVPVEQESFYGEARFLDYWSVYVQLQTLTLSNTFPSYIIGSDYIQRPEVLESNFYAWRATGDTKYLDRAASAVKVSKILGLNDVNNIAAGLQDVTESFWFAETLKVLSLPNFDEPGNISLDNYVFNTEGQVFKAPPAKAVYGSGNIAVPAGTFTSKTVTGPVPAISPGPLLSFAPGPQLGV
ncbi:seven-hairpin glycosidase [Gymnopus androsaceus JB14]|uniref:alpha-1,2-Mannosidase n=1 Tax=Gymnopus androsaceus JB14 TaxID=1447944 RepID=A0A6A4GE86_9AGAR|nr:seven-hairpin glycosidase [Gymnopus androsaceus JB14]